MVLEALTAKVRTFFRENLPGTDPTALLKEFAPFSRPLEFLNSTLKQQKYFSQNMSLVEPIEMVLDTRNEVGKDGKNMLVTYKWQYVPIIQTLRRVLSVPEIFSELKKRSDSCPDVISRFQDGRIFKEHPIFSNTTKLSVCIDLYYDDIETTNPLGSKTVVHKIGVFYFSIRNLPAWLSANMANIHLIGLMHSDDLKLCNGFSAILTRIMHDINILETSGMSITCNNETETVFGSLAIVTGDNLGRHQMLGFLEGFNANYFCEHCMVHRNQINTIFNEFDCPPRNVNVYRDQIQLLERQPREAGALTGLRSDCLLNQLTYWHVTQNKCGDLMHDFLEGVGPYEVKMVLSALAAHNQNINLALINQRINNFPYGSTDKKNRPSEIPNLDTNDTSKKKDLKQNAAQFWALFRLLPVMIGDLVPFEDKFWSFYLQLRNLADLLFAQKWARANLGHYRTLLEEHMVEFSHLFPQHDMIPKHHHLLHYATHCDHSGPPYFNMVMSEEMKHNFFKRIAHIMCNFKNVPYSLAMRHQLFSMYTLLSGKVLRHSVQVKRCSTLPVSQLPAKEDICAKFGCTEAEEFTVASEFLVRGQVYKEGMFVIIGKTVDLLVFGRIFGALTPSDDNLCIICTVLQTLRFDSHYWSYVCAPTDRFSVVEHEKLLDYHPLDGYSIVSRLNTDEIYITLRYNVFSE